MRVQFNLKNYSQKKKTNKSCVKKRRLRQMFGINMRSLKMGKKNVIIAKKHMVNLQALQHL